LDRRINPEKAFAMTQTTQIDQLESSAPGTGSPINRLSSSSLQEQAYQELRHAIRSGRFSSGELLTLRGLAEMLGTSLTPVREAARRLIHENTLELLPNRSMRVPLLSLQRFDELTDVRATLEGRAAALACEHMTTADYSGIRAANERNSAAVDKGDLPGLIRANQEFHFRIYEAARSTLLLSMIEQLWQQSGPYLAALIHAHGPEKQSDELHQIALVHHFELLAALGARDAEAASKAMSLDIIDAAQWYRGRIFLQQISEGASAGALP